MAGDGQIQHLLRRAGFGASPAELPGYEAMGFTAAVNHLVNYENVPDTVDSLIGAAGYAGTTSRGAFQPNTNLTDARQRWLFRMVHSPRPLQEKMTLFWHNHFATAYGKIAGAYGAEQATRMLAAKPTEDISELRGQIELLRDGALGSFRDLLLSVAMDPAMLVWLDGASNTKANPQENFGRELMELFTMGVGFYTETDVYAAARAFTGWNLRRIGGSPREDPTAYFAFSFNAGQHETSAKAFSFPVYPDGGRVIPARSATDGMRDGIDLINACARHPETARRLARKLWGFFVSEVHPPDEGFVSTVAGVYLQSGYNMRRSSDGAVSVLQRPGTGTRQYSWPVEFVVRAIKEVGGRVFLNSALSPPGTMGQQLFGAATRRRLDARPGLVLDRRDAGLHEPAATLTASQRPAIANAAAGKGPTPQALLSYYLDRLSPAPYDAGAYGGLLGYLGASGAWTGSNQQITVKAPGLVHLIVGSSEYQLV
jgi:hypothetical protein